MRLILSIAKVGDEKPMSFDVVEYLKESSQRIEEYADKVLLSATKMPATLGEAMRYSFFAGGKRIRPALSFAAATAVSGEYKSALPFACAIEMIHTYSLIHDDLPSMDDDDMRRGKPTNHVKFGEATAILSGDALLTDAFLVISTPEVMNSVGPNRAIACINLIAKAAGGHGMVAGQVLDMISAGHTLDLPTLEYLHAHKTGALIRAALLVGALSAGATGEEERLLTRYADRVGLAFQVSDDILDVEGNSEEMGKPVGSDEGLNKATYPALLGLSESKEHLKNLTNEAIESLDHFGKRGESLRGLANFVATRNH
jgi:geranylgeranyl diphosphate synthase type II